MTLIPQIRMIMARYCGPSHMYVDMLFVSLLRPANLLYHFCVECKSTTDITSYKQKPFVDYLKK